MLRTRSRIGGIGMGLRVQFPRSAGVPNQHITCGAYPFWTNDMIFGPRQHRFFDYVAFVFSTGSAQRSPSGKWVAVHDTKVRGSMNTWPPQYVPYTARYIRDGVQQGELPLKRGVCLDHFYGNGLTEIVPMNDHPTMGAPINGSLYGMPMKRYADWMHNVQPREHHTNVVYAGFSSVLTNERHNGWYGDLTLDPHGLPESETTRYYKAGYAKVWETVGGFKFTNSFEEDGTVEFTLTYKLTMVGENDPINRTESGSWNVKWSGKGVFTTQNSPLLPSFVGTIRRTFTPITLTLSHGCLEDIYSVNLDDVWSSDVAVPNWGYGAVSTMVMQVPDGGRPLVLSENLFDSSPGTQLSGPLGTAGETRDAFAKDAADFLHRNLEAGWVLSSAKAVDNLAGIQVSNLLEAASEVGEIPDMMRLADLIRSMVSFRSVDDIPKLIRDIADANLLTQFGLIPAGQTGIDIAKIAEELTTFAGGRIFSSTVGRGTVGMDLVNFPSMRYWKGRVEWRTTVYLSENLPQRIRSLLLPRAIGLLPSLSSLWDLVPFSFFFDWFYPVGKLLRSFENRMIARALPIGYYCHTVNIFADIPSGNNVFRKWSGGQFGRYVRLLTNQIPLWKSLESSDMLFSPISGGIIPLATSLGVVVLSR